MLYKLEPNDTIVMCDSIVVKLKSGASCTWEYVNDNATNWADVEIAKYISISIICVALICLLGFIYAKTIESQTHRQPEKLRFEDSKIEKVLKMMAELLAQKLSLYKQYCYKETTTMENDDKNTKLKPLGSQEVNDYIAALNEEISRITNKLNLPS